MLGLASTRKRTVHAFSATTSHNEMKFIDEQYYADTLISILRTSHHCTHIQTEKSPKWKSWYIALYDTLS
jgi:hypothetical protein